MAKILNIGSINIDYVYAVPHFVRSGETLFAESRRIFPGGKGLNQSVALARAGADIGHAGIVGDDGIGCVKVLSDAGVDTNLIEKSKASTGHTVIQVTPEGRNCILLYQGANRELDEGFVDRALKSFGEGDILVLQNEVSCIGYAMKAAAAKKMKIAFNPSPMDAKIPGYPLELVTWFLLNEIEGHALTGEKEPDGILRSLGEKYESACVVLTLGEAGVCCISEGRIHRHRAYETSVVDTTAAGDTFTGYFISSMASGKTLNDSLGIASIAASIAVSQKGAAVSIPCMDEVMRQALALGAV